MKIIALVALLALSACNEPECLHGHVETIWYPEKVTKIVQPDTGVHTDLYTDGYYSDEFICDEYTE